MRDTIHNEIVIVCTANYTSKAFWSRDRLPQGNKMACLLTN